MSQENLASQPDKYAVLGNPIAHSKSPQIHRLFAEQTQQNLVYEAILLDEEELNFPQQMKIFYSQGYKGFNITVPFKLDAFETADHLTERAKVAQAVNTFKFLEDGTILGDNTDGAGLVLDITQHGKFSIKDKKVLILGAGGAVQGVLHPIIQEQPASIHLANRTVKRAESIAQRFAESFKITASSWEDIPAQEYDLIINGTAASLDNKIPPIDPYLIGSHSLVYDMMYQDEPTIFLKWAKEHQPECQTMDGLGMLVGQAAESFEIWRGVKPEIASVIAEVKSSLN